MNNPVDGLLESLRRSVKAEKVILITVDSVSGVGVGTIGFSSRAEAVGSFELAKAAYFEATNRPVIQPPNPIQKVIQ